MDWRFRISFAAFLDDVVFASIMSRRAPACVRLGYATCDRSHRKLLGTRQIGQGYIDRTPRIVVA